MRLKAQAVGADVSDSTQILAGASGAGQVTGTHAIVFGAALAVGLCVDESYEIWGQLVASIGFWALTLGFLHQSRGELRSLITACLVWAMVIEVIGSLIWGVYTYRLFNVPPFVPPGHVLMFAIALVLADRFPRWVLAAAPAIAIGYALYALGTGRDMLSVVVTPFFVVALWLSKKRHVFAATFLVALPLEFLGTWLGNWRWAHEVPGLALSMANPPVCIGAVYCVRDALAGCTVAAIRHWRLRRSSKAGESSAGRPVGAARSV